jgi:hypothetical protein
MAGTIFHRTRTPLTVWFASAWYLTSSKNGVSAKTLHRILGFGSYQTAWAMLHRFRCAISHAEHDMLSGHVEVDETVFGGVRHGKRGRGAEGKVLVVVAVELISPKGFGRCRLQIIPNAETETTQVVYPEAHRTRFDHLHRRAGILPRCRQRRIHPPGNVHQRFRQGGQRGLAWRTPRCRAG